MGGTALMTGMPRELSVDGSLIRVRRAWPVSRRDGSGALTIRIEGRDDRDRLRAGQVGLRAGDDAGWTVEKVRLAPAGTDDRLPDLAEILADGGDLVVHRHRRRAVIARPDEYVKVVRPGMGAGLAHSTRVGHDLAVAAGLAAPKVLGMRDGVLRMSVLPGRSLHDLGRGCDLGDWAGHWRDWSHGWRRLVRSGADLPTRTPADEATHLQTWLGHVTAFGLLPDHRDRLAEQVRRVQADLVTDEPDAPVVTHADLHDKQLLTTGSGMSVLDFDTACLAEPALDLANLAMHAHLRHRQRVWSAAHSDLAVQRLMSTARAVGVTPQRLRTYAAATRLRLACLYAFRPGHDRVARELVESPGPVEGET